MVPNGELERARGQLLQADVLVDEGVVPRWVDSAPCHTCLLLASSTFLRQQVAEITNRVSNKNTSFLYARIFLEKIALKRQ